MTIPNDRSICTMTIAEFGEEIRLLKDREGQREKRLNILAREAFRHLMRDQAAPASDLMVALGLRSFDGQSVACWFERFAPCEVIKGKDKAGKLTIKVKLAKDRTPDQFDLDGADDTSCLGMRPINAPKVYRAEQLAKRLATLSKNEEKDGHKPATDACEEYATIMLTIIEQASSELKAKLDALVLADTPTKK